MNERRIYIVRHAIAEDVPAPRAATRIATADRRGTEDEVPREWPGDDRRGAGDAAGERWCARSRRRRSSSRRCRSCRSRPGELFAPMVDERPPDEAPQRRARGTRRWSATSPTSASCCRSGSPPARRRRDALKKGAVARIASGTPFPQARRSEWFMTASQLGSVEKRERPGARRRRVEQLQALGAQAAALNPRQRRLRAR